MDINGAAAIVTGGASGIGEASARALDEALWTFSDGSFVPHGLWSGESAPIPEPVAVGWKHRFGYDDSLDVVGVHLVGGLVGTLLVTPAHPAGGGHGRRLGYPGEFQGEVAIGGRWRVLGRRAGPGISVRVGCHLPPSFRQASL